MIESDKKLLTRIYQDAKIGTLAIEEVIKKTQNEKFKELISNQQNQYDLIAKEADVIAKANDVSLPDNNFFKKIKQIAMINLSLLANCTDRRIAEMMITGTVMGIIDAIKSIYDLEDSESEILALAKKLQTLQEKYVEDLKQYLK